MLVNRINMWHFAFLILSDFSPQIEEKRHFLQGFCLKNGADFSSLWRHFLVIFRQKSLQQKSCCKKCAKLPSVQNRSKNERKTPVSFNNRSITAQWYSINLWLGSHSTYDWAVTLPMTGQSQEHWTGSHRSHEMRVKNVLKCRWKRGSKAFSISPKTPEKVVPKTAFSSTIITFVNTPLGYGWAVMCAEVKMIYSRC